MLLVMVTMVYMHGFAGWYASDVIIRYPEYSVFWSLHMVVTSAWISFISILSSTAVITDFWVITDRSLIVSTCFKFVRSLVVQINCVVDVCGPSFKMMRMLSKWWRWSEWLIVTAHELLNHHHGIKYSVETSYLHWVNQTSVCNEHSHRFIRDILARPASYCLVQENAFCSFTKSYKYWLAGFRDGYTEFIIFWHSSSKGHGESLIASILQPLS